MARKQAKRRKPQRRKKTVKLPKIALGRFVLPLAAVSVVLLTYELSARLLDRPIDTIAVNGPFQRVTALQIEEAIAAELEDGFVSADLAGIQRRIVSMPWIDQASVARRPTR